MITPPPRPRLRYAWIKFRKHRHHAKKRGIPFLFTFDEWWNIWIKSGHWYEMGITRGKFQMARMGDRGGYTKDNVRIITQEENKAEYIRTAETRAKISTAQRGQKRSLETRAKISAARKGRKGKPHSAETRAKLSIAALRQHERAATEASP